MARWFNPNDPPDVKLKKLRVELGRIRGVPPEDIPDVDVDATWKTLIDALNPDSEFDLRDLRPDELDQVYQLYDDMFEDGGELVPDADKYREATEKQGALAGRVRKVRKNPKLTEEERAAATRDTGFEQSSMRTNNPPRVVTNPDGTEYQFDADGGFSRVIRPTQGPATDGITSSRGRRTGAPEREPVGNKRVEFSLEERVNAVTAFSNMLQAGVGPSPNPSRGVSEGVSSQFREQLVTKGIPRQLEAIEVLEKEIAALQSATDGKRVLAPDDQLANQEQAAALIKQLKKAKARILGGKTVYEAMNRWNSSLEQGIADRDPAKAAAAWSLTPLDTEYVDAPQPRKTPLQRAQEEYPDEKFEGVVDPAEVITDSEDADAITVNVASTGVLADNFSTNAYPIASVRYPAGIDPVSGGIQYKDAYLSGDLYTVGDIEDFAGLQGILVRNDAAYKITDEGQLIPMDEAEWRQLSYLLPEYPASTREMAEAASLNQFVNNNERYSQIVQEVTEEYDAANEGVVHDAASSKQRSQAIKAEVRERIQEEFEGIQSGVRPRTGRKAYQISPLEQRRRVKRLTDSQGMQAMQALQNFYQGRLPAGIRRATDTIPDFLEDNGLAPSSKHSGGARMSDDAQKVFEMGYESGPMDLSDITAPVEGDDLLRSLMDERAEIQSRFEAYNEYTRTHPGEPLPAGMVSNEILRLDEINAELEPFKQRVTQLAYVPYLEGVGTQAEYLRAVEQAKADAGATVDVPITQHDGTVVNVRAPSPKAFAAQSAVNDFSGKLGSDLDRRIREARYKAAELPAGFDQKLKKLVSEYTNAGYQIPEELRKALEMRRQMVQGILDEYGVDRTVHMGSDQDPAIASMQKAVEYLDSVLAGGEGLRPLGEAGGVYPMGVGEMLSDMMANNPELFMRLAEQFNAGAGYGGMTLGGAVEQALGIEDSILRPDAAEPRGSSFGSPLGEEAGIEGPQQYSLPSRKQQKNEAQTPGLVTYQDNRLMPGETSSPFEFVKDPPTATNYAATPYFTQARELMANILRGNVDKSMLKSRPREPVKRIPRWMAGSGSGNATGGAAVSRKVLQIQEEMKNYQPGTPQYEEAAARLRKAVIAADPESNLANPNGRGRAQAALAKKGRPTLDAEATRTTDESGDPINATDPGLQDDFFFVSPEDEPAFDSLMRQLTGREEITDERVLKLRDLIEHDGGLLTFFQRGWLRHTDNVKFEEFDNLVESVLKPAKEAAAEAEAALNKARAQQDSSAIAAARKAYDDANRQYAAARSELNESFAAAAPGGMEKLQERINITTPPTGQYSRPGRPEGVVTVNDQATIPTDDTIRNSQGEPIERSPAMESQFYDPSDPTTRNLRNFERGLQNPQVTRDAGYLTQLRALIKKEQVADGNTAARALKQSLLDRINERLRPLLEEEAKYKADLDRTQGGETAVNIANRNAAAREEASVRPTTPIETGQPEVNPTSLRELTEPPAGFDLGEEIEAPGTAYIPGSNPQALAAAQGYAGGKYYFSQFDEGSPDFSVENISEMEAKLEATQREIAELLGPANSDLSPQAIDQQVRSMRAEADLNARNRRTDNAQSMREQASRLEELSNIRSVTETALEQAKLAGNQQSGKPTIRYVRLQDGNLYAEITAPFDRRYSQNFDDAPASSLNKIGPTISKKIYVPVTEDALAASGVQKVPPRIETPFGTQKSREDAIKANATSSMPRGILTTDENGLPVYRQVQAKPGDRVAAEYPEQYAKYVELPEDQRPPTFQVYLEENGFEQVKPRPGVLEETQERRARERSRKPYTSPKEQPRFEYDPAEEAAARQLAREEQEARRAARQAMEEDAANPDNYEPLPDYDPKQDAANRIREIVTDPRVIGPVAVAGATAVGGLALSAARENDEKNKQQKRISDIPALPPKDKPAARLKYGGIPALPLNP